MNDLKSMQLKGNCQTSENPKRQNRLNFILRKLVVIGQQVFCLVGLLSALLMMSIPFILLLKMLGV